MYFAKFYNFPVYKSTVGIAQFTTATSYLYTLYSGLSKNFSNLMLTFCVKLQLCRRAQEKKYKNGTLSVK